MGIILVSNIGPRESIGQTGPEGVVSGVIAKPKVKSPSPSVPKTSLNLAVNKLKKNTPKKMSISVKPNPEASLIGGFDKAKYDVAGKVDPFVPLVQNPNGDGSRGKQIPVKPKRILTPLEKMELNQLKLVAIITTSSRRIAMVEEMTGKGYEVNIGTYIGKNSGQVTSIEPDGIKVKEYVTDYKGRAVARYQQIKLRKGNDGE
ncbi:MAG: pilus assembly protein PilP [Desulfobacterales bacterium]|nr:pilus assembly protein PilP [Desulfobacterales bacterium]